MPRKLLCFLSRYQVQWALPEKDVPRRALCPWADELLSQQLQGAAVDVNGAAEAAALGQLRLRVLPAEGDVHISPGGTTLLPRVLAHLCKSDNSKIKASDGS